MPVMEISIVPLGTCSASVSRYVAAALSRLRAEADVIFELTAMGTIVQAGSVPRLLEIAGRMHAAVGSLAGVERILTTIKLDERTDKPSGIEEKLQSVRRLLDQQQSGKCGRE